MSHPAKKFRLFRNEASGTLPASTDLRCERHESLDLTTLTRAVCLDDFF